MTERLTEITSGYYKEIDNCIITSIKISHPDSSSGAFSLSETTKDFCCCCGI